MTKKEKTQTANSQIRSALRMLFLRSFERAKVLKESKYTCATCGAKQSRAKSKEIYVEVHHLNNIVWENLTQLIRELLLNAEMEVLCKECHAEETILQRQRLKEQKDEANL